MPDSCKSNDMSSTAACAVLWSLSAAVQVAGHKKNKNNNNNNNNNE